MQENLQKIREILEGNQTFALFGHENIDGDALGAILGLGKLLEKQGKTVSYFTPNKPSRVFDFLNLWDKVKYEFDYGKYDVLVFLDFNHYKRISAFTNGREDYFDPQLKIIMDHHQPDVEAPNTIIYRDTSEISTCSLLYGVTRQWRNDLLDAEIATWWYMGISTDSGNFRYDEGEQSVRLFHLTADLLALGANKKLVIDEIFRNKTYRSVQFMQQILQRMQKVKVMCNGFGGAQEWSQEGDSNGVVNVIYSYYVDDELKALWVDHDEADMALYVMQDIRNNDLVILIKKVGIYLKASIRSRGAVDCSLLARSFGGWGHKNAAGFKIQGKDYIEQDLQFVIEQIQEHLQNLS